MATKPSTRGALWRQALTAIAAVQFLAMFSVAAGAQAAPASLPPQPTVSAAEVTAFMQRFRQDPSELRRIESNPKRVPLLLGAVQREPAGPWVNLLQALCFQTGRAATWNQPPEQRAQVSARAVEYLSVARGAVAKAMETDPRNRQLTSNLSGLDQSITLAKAESVPRTNAVPTAVAAGRQNSAPTLRGQACGSGLKQIHLAKEMWKEDHKKPDDASPTAADLAYYFPPAHRLPKCPEGGTYTIGKLNEKPRCSVPSHEFPKGQ